MVLYVYVALYHCTSICVMLNERCVVVGVRSVVANEITSRDIEAGK